MKTLFHAPSRKPSHLSQILPFLFAASVNKKRRGLSMGLTAPKRTKTIKYCLISPLVHISFPKLASLNATCYLHDLLFLKCNKANVTSITNISYVNSA